MGSVADFRKKHKDLISNYGKKNKIDEDILGAFLIVESSGSGFKNGKINIRFENHCFLNDESTKKHKGVYFDYSSDKKFTGHVYRKDPKKEWNKCHVNQTQEHDAFEFAISLNAKKAYESTSYGLAQIMGFNYKSCGYNSAKEMYEDFATGEEAQLEGFINFIVNNKNLLNACKNKDFKKMAQYYNGSGNVNDYAPRLEKAYKEFQLLSLKEKKLKNENKK